ncbi:hypothetical protein ACFXK0_25885 [Nocardia sp. NPDC059177]|uniref:hypothetical protein n=1 Tax=Nocardia sp. NPDC059177 TaxID=3346759 RepID=UPI0036B3D45A
MSDWVYYLRGPEPPDEAGDNTGMAMTRIPAGELTAAYTMSTPTVTRFTLMMPKNVAAAQTVGRDGQWHPDERPSRLKYLGADYEYWPIDEHHAAALLHRWVEVGRIARIPADPDPQPGGTDPETSESV